MVLENYLKTYFGIVDVDQLQSIVSLFRLQTIRKGDFLLKNGNRCEFLSFIKSGFLRIYVDTDGKEITQWIATKDYFCTDLASFIFNKPATFSIHSITDTEIYCITKSDYDKIVSIVPQWYQLEKLFIVRCFSMLESRILSHLSMTAEERYQLLFQHNPELFNQVPLQYIASMLGMTAETFSRIRKKQLF
jgi:CRP-like cAMP-binding protein